ncbi:helix-turn-helix domain-containing protein [Haloterrigena sp. SYSU A558-1]|uniref:Helix-turn-helix domain-containing protein n=1 Tax=Haloterrigena gelatinilytica TaxID=2741724 RepID=A0A8J8KHM7_9EURY|nr:helix-turn-helix domain-containing protein [Haloterrigena gelatinilytica]NUB91319.1 helix-turn-helix domain-containing protein [Haloterrigena gelatinilytica]NUC72942.1 helix-turn-helix domain-containing protein [Haloterrigena gelatinilytica]
MVVIADITVPADTFPLGRVLDDYPAVEIELERIVPLREAIVPLFWIAGAESGVIETSLLEHSKTETVEILTTKDDKTLFEVHWSSDINGLIQALIDTQAKILEASGTAETWDFRLRFPSHEQLSSFNMALTDEGIPITLRHIYNPSMPEGESPLSSEQRETLRLAYREGYFEIPRRTTQTRLADDIGISDSALSQRIRRGVNILIEQSLFADDQPET